MPRFVILEHDHPVRHWDLMLEMGNVLRTWRLELPPKARQSIAAELSFDHRLIYLDYEGPISNGRGNVVRWDLGSYEMETQATGTLIIRVAGRRLVGRIELHSDSNGRATFLFEPNAEESAQDPCALD